MVVVVVAGDGCGDGNEEGEVVGEGEVFVSVVAVARKRGLGDWKGDLV